MAIAFTATPGNLRLENMRVTIGGVAMGGTVGGIEIACVTDWIKQKIDQKGSTNFEAFNAGDNVTVKFTLAETTYANLAKALGPTALLRSSGGTAVGLGGAYAGAKRASTSAVALIFHPLDIDDATLTNDVNCWLALLTKLEPIKLGGGEVTLFATEWELYPDTSKAIYKQLIDFGLAAAT